MQLVSFGAFCLFLPPRPFRSRRNLRRRIFRVVSGHAPGPVPAVGAATADTCEAEAARGPGRGRRKTVPGVFARPGSELRSREGRSGAPAVTGDHGARFAGAVR